MPSVAPIIGSVAERLAPAQVGRVVLDTGSARNMVTSAISDAKGTLFMEVHGFRGSRPEGALGRFLRHGGSAEVLASDKVVFDDLRKATTATAGPSGGTTAALDGADPALAGRINFVQYDDLQHYQHSKIIASTGGFGGRPSALMNNVKLGDMSSSRPDVAVELTGRSARAALDVIRTSLHGTPAQVARKVDAARAVGVLWNEPLAGRQHLSNAMRDAVDGATDTLMVVSKGIDSDDFARALVAAQERGVKVGVSVRDMSRSSAQILREGGVPAYLHSTRAAPTRVNLLVADGERGIASTAYQWNRMLGEAADGIYPRESGVVLDRAALAQLREPMLKSYDTKLALDLIDNPEAALRTHAAPGRPYTPSPWSPMSLVDSHAGGDSRLVRQLD